MRRQDMPAMPDRRGRPDQPVSLPEQIIDCHIHPAIDADTSYNWFGPSGDFARQVDALRRAGVTRACGALIKAGMPESFSAIRILNDLALRLRDRFPDFYIPGIQVHPHFPDESCREIERCCGREGVRWIGELVGYLMGYRDEYASDAALTIMRAAAAHGAVVNFHCHDLEALDRLCAGAPTLKLVLAHPGGGKDEISRRLAKVAQYPNLHLDISGSGIDRLGILRWAMDIAGKEKLLFGTDFPINNPAVHVHGALFEALASDEYDALFAGNFLRLTQSGLNAAV